MARTYLVFVDIEGKLEMLRVECTRCQRKGRYSVRRLIEKYRRQANMMKWSEQLNGDCPKQNVPGVHGRCDLICPDLPKCCEKAPTQSRGLGNDLEKSVHTTDTEEPTPCIWLSARRAKGRSLWSRAWLLT